ALAVSALYFDLSVWDVFGVLSAGARLVLIPQQAQREAAIWLSLVQQHQVTVWNSVPALLEMMLLFNEQIFNEQDEQPPALPSLRVVMLSGDWIVPELPQRLRRFAPNAHCVAMGGATEAAIWSNYWIADTALTGWCSVPYGVPLPNQQFRIVNEQEEDCPDWVAGELWIGGQGVAQGYYGDSAGTEQQFILRDGQRWYRTGDTGRYRPDAI
ncbi:siderophore biosysnthesis protein, partial [Yersinia pestis]